MASSRRPARQPPFESIYRHGFARVAVATPRVEVASPAINVAGTLELAHRAADEHAVLAVFPELGLSAYSNEDLFQQDALLDASLAALQTLVAASRELPLALAAGLPLRADDRLFNCGVLVHRGRILGAVPKSYLPNYREFYEKRHFAPAAQAVSSSAATAGPGRAVRRRPAVRGQRPARLRAARRDLRGPLGAVAAEHARRARRGDGAREPLGERHHGGQGGLSPPALRLAVREMRRGLSLLGRRAGRIDDGPGLGRPRADLRERRAACGVDALSARAWADHRGPRPRPPAPGARTADELRRQRTGARRPGARVPPHRFRDRRARRTHPAASPRSSASRTCRPIPPVATSAAPRSTTSRSRG